MLRHNITETFMYNILYSFSISYCDSAESSGFNYIFFFYQAEGSYSITSVYNGGHNSHTYIDNIVYDVSITPIITTVNPATEGAAGKTTNLKYLFNHSKAYK